MVSLRHFLTPLWTFAYLAVLFSPSAVLAQSISVTIPSAIGPAGTLENPHFVIDSDALNSDPAYDRDTVTGTATARFTRDGSGTISGTYRMTAQLIDKTGAVVPLANSNVGAGTVVSEEFVISFSGFLVLPNNQTRTFNLKPATDLGAGGDYRIRYRVQQLIEEPKAAWGVVAGPVNTSSFVVVHFNDVPEDPNARYLRGYLMDAPVWVKVNALQTNPVIAARSFQASVPYRLWRYDVGGSAVLVPLRFTIEMRDDLGAMIPLENGGVATVTTIPSAFTAGAPNQPRLQSGTPILSFRPSVQLDSRNRTYQVRMKFEHREKSSPETFIDNGTSGDSSLTQVLHFNGKLRIASGINQINGQFTAYSNSPSYGTTGTGFVNTTINVTAGTFPGFPDYTFGNGSAINVRLRSNGDAEATFISQPVQVANSGQVEGDIGGVRVIYPGAFLTTSGAVANEARVRLPQGLSYTPGRTASAGRFLPEFVVPGSIQLTGQFHHSGNLSQVTSADAWIFDESRTLLYKTTQFVMTDAGEIRFTTPDAEWVHAQAWATLDQDGGDKLHQDPEMAVRHSNEGYLRKAQVAASPSSTTIFTAGIDGTARCKQADLRLSPVSFVTHFPAGVELTMKGIGELRIRDGLVSTTESFLQDVTPFIMSYDRSCEGDDCGPDPSLAMTESLMEVDGGNLALTPDGGLHGRVWLPATELRWGLRGDGTSAHRSDEFETGEFLAPGNQIYQAASPIAASGPLVPAAGHLGPAMIMLAGYDADGSGQPVYFGTSEYRNGTGAWPGATFTVDAPGSIGASRIADMAEDYLYDLEPEVTKYYIRKSGLSGRHVAPEKLPTSKLKLYGYDFGFSRFQLTFLSNVNRMSWINGVVRVPFPSDFTQNFTELMLTCTGGLDHAEIDPSDSGTKPLRYWNGAFTPLSMRFAPQEGAGCYADRFLTLGLVSGAANIETPLAGSLAFRPDGNIATPADNIVGVDGRLGLPPSVPLDGPANEQYRLNPVSKLYFNNPEIPGAPGNGFVSFAAICNVPFFQDLKLHVMTSAQADAPAPVFLAGGWQEGGKTFFSNAQFDSENRGFPAGVDVGSYQRPNEKTDYVVSATQSIFGIVELTYPLRWSPDARFFQSWEPEEDNLLVLLVEHQVDYLSGENAEITFGTQYDGLPSLNLASTAYDAVDEQLGAARSITAAAQGFITDTLNQGVDEIGNLVNDNLENLLDQAINQVEAQVIDPLYQAILDSYAAAVAANQSYNDWVTDSTDGLLAVFNHNFATVETGADTVIGYLNQLSSVADDASSLIARVDQALARGILAIDSVAGEIRTYRDIAGNIVVDLELPEDFVEDDVIPGILALVELDDGSLERQIVQRLVSELIRELAPPELAAILNPLLADLSSDLNAKLQQLLEKFDPTLNRVTDVLMQAREYLVLVREKLQSGQEIVLAFQQILSNAESEIVGIVNGVRNTAETFIGNIATALASPFDEPLAEIGGLIDEFDKDEFVAMLRAELRDRLLIADFIQQKQYVLRQYISELDMAMRSAIDSAFAEVNRMCKQLIKDALGPIDDTINGLIGEVNSVVGAGSVDGYAHIQGDTLRRLRLDAEVELKVPDEMKLQAYFEMLCYDSSTTTGTSGATPCIAEGEKVVEVRIGALDVPLDWISPEMRADLGLWFAMKTEPQVRPRGLGGSLTMTGGVLDFQSFKVTAFSAAVAMGAQENYLAASARVIVSDYEASGGIFFGRTCSIEPLKLVDPDAASLLGQPPFTGAYVYGEVWLPISEVLLGIPASCMFRISAGVGAGAFYFVEGPTYGGRMLLGVSGEALCIVSIRGEVSMTGVMRAGSLNFSGRGTIVGKAGVCPFCVKFRESAKVTYSDGSWSVDL